MGGGVGGGGGGENIGSDVAGRRRHTAAPKETPIADTTIPSTVTTTPASTPATTESAARAAWHETRALHAAKMSKVSACRAEATRTGDVLTARKVEKSAAATVFHKAMAAWMQAGSARCTVTVCEDHVYYVQ